MRAPFLMMQGLWALGGFEKGGGGVLVDGRFMSDIRGLGLPDRKALATEKQHRDQNSLILQTFLITRASL